MLEAMRCYREIGFTGVMRPDHVPTLEGDANDLPGYTTRGRLYATGSMRGLLEAVESERL
jgi:mannonate dehydratase